MMRGSLPDRLSTWLGVEPTAAGDAATWRLELLWPWPPWFTVLLVVASVAWVAAIYRHEASSAGPGFRAVLAALRLAALGVLLVMLSQAVITLQQTAPPAIALLVDRSASMSTVDKYDDSPLAASIRERIDRSDLDESTRLHLAKILLSESDDRLLHHLASAYQLQAFAVAEGIERLPADEVATLATAIRALASGGLGSEATRLGDAIEHVLDQSSDFPLSAILLFTDGIVTEGASLSQAAQDARRSGVPLIVVGLGSDRRPRDIEMSDVLVDDVVFLDDLVSFHIQIEATGLAGESAKIVLLQEGSAAPLIEQTIMLGADGERQSAFLTYRPATPGDHPFVVEVVPLGGESNRDNNRQRRTIRVHDEKIRVLLAFGYPSYEFRFLKSLLERDGGVELATYLQDADPDYAEQDRTALRSFPIARDELLAYDVILLGDVDPRRLPRSVWPDVQSLVTERGGGVVFIAGPRWLPWDFGDVSEAAALMPIDVAALNVAEHSTLPADVTRGFVVEPTPLGLQLPPFQLGDTRAESERIWRSLAPLYWLAPIEQLAPAAQVLAEHPTHTASTGRRWPVIVMQYAGAGRVLFHATDSTWQWRLGAGEVYFSRYWVQTIRYLARGKLAHGRGAALTTNRREYERGETVEIRVRFLDPRLAPPGDQVTVAVETPGQPRRRIALQREAATPGLFEGSLAGLGEGDYELSLAEPQAAGDAPRTRFTVRSPVGEMARIAMDRAALTAAAEATRGKFYDFTDAGKLVDELPRGRRVPVANFPPLALWNRWWLLSIFLAAIITEWILRKRKGML